MNRWRKSNGNELDNIKLFLQVYYLTTTSVISIEDIDYNYLRNVNFILKCMHIPKFIKSEFS